MLSVSKPYLRLAAALSMALALPPLSLAAGLQVSPISLQISSNRNADGIWLTNSSTEPLTAQVRVFQWSQQNGDDLLAQTTGLTVSPPLVDIPAGGRQLVRVLRTSAPPAVGAEATYRLIIDELPPDLMVAPPAPAASEAAPARRSFGMSFLMRYSVPVFVGDASEAAVKTAGEQLSWSLQKSSESWTFKATNHGAIRAQLAELHGIGTDGQTWPLQGGLMGYVLAGQTRQWSVAAPSQTQAQTLTGFQAMINSEAQRIHVPAAP